MQALTSQQKEKLHQALLDLRVELQKLLEDSWVKNDSGKNVCHWAAQLSTRHLPENVLRAGANAPALCNRGYEGKHNENNSDDH